MSESCRTTRAQLSEHLDGELAAAAAARVRTHLDGCADCRRELELLRLTVGALRRLPELPAPAGILAGVRERLRPEPWYRRLLSGREWLVGVPIGALATLLVVVGVSLFQARYPGIGTVGTPGRLEERRQVPAPAQVPGSVPAALPEAAPEPPPEVTVPAAVPARRPDRVPDAPAATRAKDKDTAPRRLAAAGEAGADRRSPPTPSAGPAAAGEFAAAPAPAIGESSVGDEREAAVVARTEAVPGRFLIPEPAPAGERATPPGDIPSDPEAVDTGVPRRRGAAIDALEVRPRTVTTLRSLPEAAHESKAARADAGSPRRAGSAASPPVVAARRQAAEFRKVGAPDGTDREASGVVDLGAASPAPAAPAEPAAQLEARRPPGEAAPLRIVCLLAPDGDSLDDFKRLLRREGAGEVVVRALEPRAVRDAFAPHRGRFSRRAEPARGWSLRAEIAPRLAGRLLDALANQPGVLVLEYTELTTAQARQPGPLLVRLTVLR